MRIIVGLLSCVFNKQLNRCNMKFDIILCITPNCVLCGERITQGIWHPQMANKTSSFKARFTGNIAPLSRSPLMSNVPRFKTVAAVAVTRYF